MKRYLTARFDVTDLTERQRDSLAGHIGAQSESNRKDDVAEDAVYPDVEYEISWDDVADETDEPRHVLVHLHVTVDPEDTRPVEEIVETINGAVEVGFSGFDENTRSLDVSVVLAEEV